MKFFLGHPDNQITAITGFSLHEEQTCGRSYKSFRWDGYRANDSVLVIIDETARVYRCVVDETFFDTASGALTVGYVDEEQDATCKREVLNLIRAIQPSQR